MRVSVCMATYNGERFIREQLESILIQLGEEDEVLISDDGSTDNTLGVVHSFQDSRIKILEFNGRNIIRNFENALKHASGKFIFLADQDDIWLPNKVNICLKYLEQYDLVFSNLITFTEDVRQGRVLYDTETPRTGILRNWIKNNYTGATMSFRRKVLEMALPIPPKVPMHDIWLGLLAEWTGSTYFIKEPLIYYRRHGENASETGQKSSNSFGKKVSMRYYLAYHLIRRVL